MKDTTFWGFIIAIFLAISMLALGVLIDRANTKLDTIQKSLDLYADEQSVHYRTVEYYLHNTMD